ncbi:potassium efflux system protein [Bacillus mesophilus]|uniref:Mechanosensitive ion channel n=1 Tax=Bacillus mesophilus TaxID=1808955 RepID=A0A6M0QAB9_9BACI|nr:mechanosensitive ion channel domain-containing protein [Bacillus mesophilus]MBM7662616.1 potassium efflux system protein [Bacillus mesophilus]NEY73316.1 mechanosensitive ion channel [Bacillus mesophilus]
MSTYIEWLNNVNYLDFFIVIAVVIGVLVLRLLVLWSTKRLQKYYDATRSMINWFTFYGILIFLLIYFSKANWMFTGLFSMGNVEITFFLIIVAILIISLASRISKITTNVLLPNIYSRYNLDKGLRFTFDRIIHYTIMVIAIITSLTTVGIDLSALTVFAGIISVGIGFGLQNIASNFISGIILLFERPIKVGDRVIVDEIIGDVEKINMRATIIKTLDNEHIIVPNSYFLEEKVVNRSFSDPKLRLVLPIGVAYGTDVDKVRELLLEVAREEHLVSPTVLTSPEPFVNFVGFGDSSLDFELFVWIADPNQFIVIKSNVNFRINRILADNNIEIPFPQRDLHIRSVDQQVQNKFK